jgi:hypothetical protein
MLGARFLHSVVCWSGQWGGVSMARASCQGRVMGPELHREGLILNLPPICQEAAQAISRKLCLLAKSFLDLPSGPSNAL